MTASDLSSITRINLKQVHRFLAGEGNPTLRTLDRYAAALGLRLRLEVVA